MRQFFTIIIFPGLIFAQLIQARSHPVAFIKHEGAKIETAAQYKTMLDLFECPTTILNIAEIDTVDLNRFDVILIEPDWDQQWKAHPDPIEKLKNSSRPILGLGEGGYQFFQHFGLKIAYPQGLHRSLDTSIVAVDPTHTIYQTPYSIEIPSNNKLNLYIESSSVGIFASNRDTSLFFIGQSSYSSTHFTIILQREHFLLWGFNALPEALTVTGKRLMVNLIHYLANLTTTPVLPSHWEFKSNTGNSATVVLPTSANPMLNDAPLVPGDYVGVFSPGGLCCGWRQWQDQNLAFTVWGDNDQTSEIDGFQTGEKLLYRVYRATSQQEWPDIEVAYSQGDGLYAANAFMVLSQFRTKPEEVPVLFVPQDTLNFMPEVDSLWFPIENHGGGELVWTVSPLQEKPWLIEIQPASGSGNADVLVVVDHQQLTQPSDTTDIVINSNGGTGQITIIIHQATGMPTHWEFTPNTGNNATVVLPYDINPSIDGSPLDSADCIGVFTPAGRCCGWVGWQKTNVAINVWGDNDQTAEIDGFQSGECLAYRVFRPVTQQEWADIEVAYTQGDGRYAVNAFMVLSEFHSPTTPVPMLHLPLDSLIFPGGLDTLIFPLENEGNGTLHWTATVAPEKPWLIAIEPTSGTGNAEVQVVVDHQKLGQPADTTTIYIESNGGTGQITVIIQQSTKIPSHWAFTPNTGNNATVILPITANPSIDGQPLDPGDCIGVFSENGLCCGWIEWQGVNIAITVWGDNTQTPEIDGLVDQEPLLYRVFRPSTSEEWTTVEVGYAQGNGLYTSNGLMILNRFEVVNTILTTAPVAQRPDAFRLLQNFPNPFNSATTFIYELANQADVHLTIIDLHGAVVQEWKIVQQPAGQHSIIWDGRDQNHTHVASGNYFYQLSIRTNQVQPKQNTFIRQLVLIK